jgi:hypothetical protein
MQLMLSLIMFQNVYSKVTLNKKQTFKIFTIKVVLLWQMIIVINSTLPKT